jgi:HEAT repeat protein
MLSHRVLLFFELAVLPISVGAAQSAPPQVPTRTSTHGRTQSAVTWTSRSGPDEWSSARDEWLRPSTGYITRSGSTDIEPPAAWAQGDPADSLYRLAKETINHTEYARAAGLFNQIWTKFPKSRYAAEAAYYEAFARYRVGTVEQLRLALTALDANKSRVADMSRKSDVPALRARILSALALRNEPGADAALKALYNEYPAICDDDDIRIRAEVLSAMYRSDPDSTMPLIREQLKTRDACSARLRKTAVFLLAGSANEQNTALVADVARSDSVRDVRRQAIDLLARMPGDVAVTTLQQLMTDPDARIRSDAVQSLMRSRNPKARMVMRSLIDQPGLSERMRVDAIQRFGRGTISPADAAYLKELYGRAGQSRRIKEAVINALARPGSMDEVDFLLSIARNQTESSSVRSDALNRISRRLDVKQLTDLYDLSDSRTMRLSLVDALADHKEKEASDKLLDIVKMSTDPDVRASAMESLLRKKDPEITKKLLALINK